MPGSVWLSVELSNMTDNINGNDKAVPVESHSEEAARAQQVLEHNMTKWEAVKEYPKAYGWAMALVWCMILVGYENQAGAIVLSVPQFRQDFGHYFQGQYVLDSQWQSAMTGGPLGAMALASFFSSWIADRFGRKWVLFVSVLLTVPFVAIEYISVTMPVFFCGKFLNALCLGIIAPVVITTTSEITPMALRGFVAAWCSLSMCIGPFICYLINNTTSTYTSRLSYRGVFFPQWIFSITSLCLIVFMPESPYYLIKKDQNEKALKALKRLFTPAQAQSQFALMKVTVEESIQISASHSYADCFKRKDLRRTLIVLFAFFMQPMSGVSFISAYSTYYYEMAGLTTQSSYQLSCGAQALSILGVIVSWFVIDRFGRRPLIIWGMCALTVLNFIVAGCGVPTGNHRAMTTACAFMAMYNFFYNIAIGPLPYIFASEVSSIGLRAKTVALGNIVNYAFQCMWTFVLPYMFNADQANMGSKINFIFGALSLLSIFAFWKFQPETAGRSFEDIDEMFAMNLPARKWKTYKTRVMQESNEVYDDLKQEVSHDEAASREELA